MADHFPVDDAALTSYAQQRIVLYPEKFGVMGQYSREMLEVNSAVDMMSHGMDSLLMRLTTSVLCGQTISETPQVEISFPDSPWQHVKHRLEEKTGRLDDRWKGYDPDSGDTVTPPPWMILLWPLLVLFPKWLKKYPVRWGTRTADINFEQRILYPEIDAPAHAGRPVIYETLSMDFPGLSPPFGSRLVNDPSRFMHVHEIAREIMKDPDLHRFAAGPDSYVALKWLERHGVNVDQLVKRG